MSQFISRTSKSMWPADWAASTQTSAPRACAIATISRIGRRVPRFHDTWLSTSSFVAGVIARSNSSMMLGAVSSVDGKRTTFTAMPSRSRA